MRYPPQTAAPTGWICRPTIYEFDGWIFEYHQTSVWPLKKDGEPRKRAGKRFYDMLGRFLELDEETRKQHRVGGGCVSF